MKPLLLVSIGILLAPGQLMGQMPASPPPATESFTGITTDGYTQPGLFSIRATGVSTEPVTAAATAFLRTLTPAQSARTLLPVDDPQWQRWDNRHRAPRQGMCFKQMTQAQRAAAFELIGAGLSAKGFRQTRDIMNLNGTLAELKDNFEDYGEWLYWVTILGTPSRTEPWGWQLDGHHCVINYFVLGDQVVMTPTFMGSEPIRAAAGRFEGTIVLQDEQDQGLAFMQSLTRTQQDRARIQPDKTTDNNLTEAHQDHVVIPFAGLQASDLNVDQRQEFLRLIETHVGLLRADHATIRMAEVEKDLARTRFAWIGDTDDDAVFYYRIHSPVLLIEFDHRRPASLRGPRVPARNHIHCVMRTPNGNDYGKDLLRQHLRDHHVAEGDEQATAGEALLPLVAGEVRVLGDSFTFTEGPASDAEGHVYFTDVREQRIHRYTTDEKLELFRENSGGANGLYFDRSGNLLACEGRARRLTSLTPAGTLVVLAKTYNGKAFNQPNDLWIDPQGGIYFSDPIYGQTGKQQDGEHVYYLSPDRSKVLRVTDDLVRPNGLIGTPDGRTLYVADHGAGIIWKYAVNPDGTLAQKQFFAEAASDGMTLDERGNIYATQDSVLVFSPDGKQIESIKTPKRPTNVTFGGAHFRTLFITARTHLCAVDMHVQGAAR